MKTFEIEIKSLLGPKENADALISSMQTLDPECQCVAKNSQLNHYFAGGDIHELYRQVEPLFKGEQHDRFHAIVEQGENFSVRTRQKDEQVLLVIKAALDGGTSENTVARLEFEEPVNVTLAELDGLIEKAGYSYQAKWSRDRWEYHYKNTNVCIDRNAGYGYLAEFETVTNDEAQADTAREKLEALMVELGVTELPQDRLARMFEHYNQNWSEYYGTDKTFTIE